MQAVQNEHVQSPAGALRWTIPPLILDERSYRTQFTDADAGSG